MTETAELTQTYWNELARIYRVLGPPLRPAAEDMLNYQQLLARHAPCPRSGSFRAVMLGVTPGMVAMRWPESTHLLAVDRNLAMVSAVWPGDLPGVRRAICGDWTALPLADHSIHTITGDGSGNCVSYPDGLRNLAAEAARVLQPGGLLLLRCYAQLEQQEDPGRVLDCLMEGSASSIHEFKFRLLMAMQETARKGVELAGVHRYWVQSRIDPERLAQATGWDAEAIRTMDAYRDSPTVHVFPTLKEFRAVLGEYFEEWDCAFASYPLAERCPVLALRAADRPEFAANGYRK